MQPVRTPQGKSRIRIVIADDHRFLRCSLMNVLEQYPDLDIVGEAVDGEQVLQMIDQYQPDVVVMDVCMPRLNGVEATRQIAASHPRVRVIGLSMHEEGTIAAHMRSAGAAAFLSKDSPVEELVAAIRASR